MFASLATTSTLSPVFTTALPSVGFAHLKVTAPPRKRLNLRTISYTHSVSSVSPSFVSSSVSSIEANGYDLERNARGTIVNLSNINLSPIKPLSDGSKLHLPTYRQPKKAEPSLLENTVLHLHLPVTGLKFVVDEKMTGVYLRRYGRTLSARLKVKPKPIKWIFKNSHMDAYQPFPELPNEIKWIYANSRMDAYLPFPEAVRSVSFSPHCQLYELDEDTMDCHQHTIYATNFEQKKRGRNGRRWYSNKKRNGKPKEPEQCSKRWLRKQHYNHCTAENVYTPVTQAPKLKDMRKDLSPLTYWKLDKLPPPLPLPPPPPTLTPTPELKEEQFVAPRRKIRIRGRRGLKKRYQDADMKALQDKIFDSFDDEPVKNAYGAFPTEEKEDIIEEQSGYGAFPCEEEEKQEELNDDEFVNWLFSDIGSYGAFPEAGRGGDSDSVI